jgi:ribosomal protein L33
MDQQFCPHCQKVAEMYLSDSKRITAAENAKTDVKPIIIESYSCQQCGSFIYSRKQKNEKI